jgi:hypothetical protein
MFDKNLVHAIVNQEDLGGRALDCGSTEFRANPGLTIDGLTRGHGQVAHLSAWSISNFESAVDTGRASQPFQPRLPHPFDCAQGKLFAFFKEWDSTISSNLFRLRCPAVTEQVHVAGWPTHGGLIAARKNHHVLWTSCSTRWHGTDFNSRGSR